MTRYTVHGARGSVLGGELGLGLRCGAAHQRLVVVVVVADLRGDVLHEVREKLRRG